MIGVEHLPFVESSVADDLTRLLIILPGSRGGLTLVALRLLKSIGDSEFLSVVLLLGLQGLLIERLLGQKLVLVLTDASVSSALMLMVTRAAVDEPELSVLFEVHFLTADML